jgi:hypothetical protein
MNDINNTPFCMNKNNSEKIIIIVQYSWFNGKVLIHYHPGNERAKELLKEISSKSKRAFGKRRKSFFKHEVGLLKNSSLWDVELIEDKFGMKRIAYV